MPEIRIIVTIRTPSDEAAAARLPGLVDHCRQVHANEEGCLQFEAFRSAMEPATLVLLERWASHELYDRHWRLDMAQRRAEGGRSGGGNVEFYHYQRYELVDEVWTPSDPEFRSEGVRW
ncbi:MAG: antibiotic biosynthesis monooxygenase [Chloroflexi bacterium]|nr:antibiotic biosynthesis monooxygenase [Chloroflexota bacterium]